jgi:hypothetical protein
METAIIPRQSWKSLETLLTWGPIWSNHPIYLVDEKKRRNHHPGSVTRETDPGGLWIPCSTAERLKLSSLFGKFHLTSKKFK